MEKHESILVLTAFSGLAGALLSQLMTGLFSFIGDRRREKTDRRNLYRGKKVEIGESFYFMSGELRAMIKKNIAYWSNRQDHQSEGAVSFLKLEMERLDVYQSKLQAENWKYNLVDIYFTIPYGFSRMIEDNKISHELYLQVLDLSEIVTRTLPQERGDVLGDYQGKLEELCRHYQGIYNRMEENMAIVSESLRAIFVA